MLARSVFTPKSIRFFNATFAVKAGFTRGLKNFEVIVTALREHFMGSLLKHGFLKSIDELFISTNVKNSLG
jgi:hypothetical protein